jgi:superfamily II DNA/RNA helicase
LSTTPVTLKRHNHRVHPCERSQKLALLKHLIALHSDKEIVIIAAQDIAALEDELDADNITLKNDSELLPNPKIKCDMVISLDLAKDPQAYMIRLNQTHTHALLLADDKEQQELYKIETLMKRTLTKEVISGFEPESYLQAQQKAKALKERQAYNIKNQEERDEKRAKASAKKKKESKYLGKDESGKPIFSGKSGERNHHYDGTPKDEAEKQYRAKPKAPRGKNQNDGKKPWEKKPGEKKPWDKRASSATDKRSNDRGIKDTNSDAEKAVPKRTGRTIRIPSRKPSKES